MPKFRLFVARLSWNCGLNVIQMILFTIENIVYDYRPVHSMRIFACGSVNEDT